MSMDKNQSFFDAYLPSRGKNRRWVVFILIIVPPAGIEPASED
jgi:hypothetical protein